MKGGFVMKKALIAILLIGFLSSLSGEEMPTQEIDSLSSIFMKTTPSELRRTKTEWFAISVVGGNVGIGGKLSFFTLRWKAFYWEILRLHASGIYYNIMAFNGGTMFGVPLFLTPDDKNEFRFGIGLSGGLNQSLKGSSILTLPIEISYLYHIKRHFTFQTGISVEIPLVLFDPEFFPVINGFIGFRF